jgi:hypothetical protein
MFGAAQADAFGAEARAVCASSGRFGIGAHLHAADPVGPAHQRAEIAAQFGLSIFTAPEPPRRLAPSMVMMSPSLTFAGADADLAALLSICKAARARDAGAAHAARDDGGVAGHAAARRHDALGGVHAVNVFGRRLDADEDHASPRSAASFSASSASNTILPRPRRAMAGRPLVEDIARRLRVERRMQQLVERAGSTRSTASSLRDQPFAAMSTAILSAALAVRLPAGLQHPELAALDGELDILHVAVMPFERSRSRQFGIGLGHGLFHAERLPPASARRLGKILRRADAGDDILALRVDQVFAIEARFRRWRDRG